MSLPPYTTLLRTLRTLPLLSLQPNTTCPICREPFAQITQHLLRTRTVANLETFNLLTHLPFQSHHWKYSPTDYPVQLPCLGQHILGRQCLRNWFESQDHANWCPECMTPLFRLPRDVASSRDKEARRKEVGRRWREEIERVEGLGGRELIVDERAWKRGMKVQVSRGPFRRKLLGMMIKVAVRLERPKVSEAERPRFGIGMGVEEPLDTICPDVEEVGERGPVGAVRYRDEIGKMGTRVPLKEGRWPRFMTLLLSQDAETMFHALVRRIVALKGRDFEPRDLCSDLLIEVRDAWGWRPMEKWEPVRLLAKNTIRMYVAHRRLITEAREVRKKALRGLNGGENAPDEPILIGEMQVEIVGNEVPRPTMQPANNQVVPNAPLNDPPNDPSRATALEIAMDVATRLVSEAIQEAPELMDEALRQADEDEDEATRQAEEDEVEDDALGWTHSRGMRTRTARNGHIHLRFYDQREDEVENQEDTEYVPSDDEDENEEEEEEREEVPDWAQIMF